MSKNEKKAIIKWNMVIIMPMFAICMLRRLSVVQSFSSSIGYGRVPYEGIILSASSSSSTPSVLEIGELKRKVDEAVEMKKRNVEAAPNQEKLKVRQ